MLPGGAASIPAGLALENITACCCVSYVVALAGAWHLANCHGDSAAAAAAHAGVASGTACSWLAAHLECVDEQCVVGCHILLGGGTAAPLTNKQHSQRWPCRQQHTTSSTAGLQHDLAAARQHDGAAQQ